MKTIEERVAERILLRAEVGRQKYGVGLERTDIDLIGWLRHLQEEMLDAANYIERACDDLERGKFWPPIDWSEAPEWANYAAMDRDGVWFYYNIQPFTIEEFWGNHGDINWSGFDHPPYPGNWRESLQARPENLID